MQKGLAQMDIAHDNDIGLIQVSIVNSYSALKLLEVQLDPIRELEGENILERPIERSDQSMPIQKILKQDINGPLSQLEVLEFESDQAPS